MRAFPADDDAPVNRTKRPVWYQVCFILRQRQKVGALRLARTERRGMGQSLAGTVQPIRVSVPIKVERSTPKLWHTAALLIPPSRAFVIASIFSGGIASGLPPCRSRRFAAARPAILHSRVGARSYWASAPNIENSTSPCGVVVTICSVSDRNATCRSVPCRGGPECSGRRR